MSKKIPDDLTRQHIINAIRDLDRGVEHTFGESTGYDLLFEERRYPPKAVLGLAVGNLTGRPLAPSDFTGGLGSKCFRSLQANGFTIITKGETSPFPDEVRQDDEYVEGAVERVLLNRYERDSEARAKAIKNYGLNCQVCDLKFSKLYGALGDGFIHVHHVVPLSSIGKSYTVDPVADLRPVCPNCHAMLHKRVPPYTVEELREVMRAAAAASG